MTKDALQVAQDGRDLVTQADRTLAAMVDTLKYMHEQYEACTDGRMEMMSFIDELKDQIGEIRGDLRDHSRRLDDVVALIQVMMEQRDSALADRDAVRKLALEITRRLKFD